MAEKICKACGRIIQGTPFGKYCQSCYRYFKDGGTEHPLPMPGTIEKDNRGYVICHICGRAYKRLGSHAKESHSMTIEEYKKEFGLCNNCRTTEDSYSEKMHNNAYINNMPERLKITGMNTRIKVGETDKRKGKEVRLQERIDKHIRMVKYVAEKRNA